MHSGQQLAALRTGTIDVGLLRESPGGTDLAMETILRESFVAVLPSRHRLAARARITPRLLAGESFILFPAELAPTLFDQIAAVCRAGDFSPRIGHEALDWHTITGLVSVGLGVSIAPAGLAGLKWPGVAYRPLQPLAVRTSIVMCRRREPGRGVVDSFAAVLRQATSGSEEAVGVGKQ
jgi:DNA-binding transcriptional LysR family regulator